MAIDGVRDLFNMSYGLRILELSLQLSQCDLTESVIVDLWSVLERFTKAQRRQYAVGLRTPGMSIQIEVSSLCFVNPTTITASAIEKISEYVNRSQFEGDIKFDDSKISNDSKRKILKAFTGSWYAGPHSALSFPRAPITAATAGASGVQYLKHHQEVHLSLSEFVAYGYGSLAWLAFGFFHRDSQSTVSSLHIGLNPYPFDGALANVFLELLAINGRQLLSLHVEDCETILDGQLLERILDLCPNLVELHIINAFCEDFTPLVNSLTSGASKIDHLTVGINGPNMPQLCTQLIEIFSHAKSSLKRLTIETGTFWEEDEEDEPDPRVELVRRAMLSMLSTPGIEYLCLTGRCDVIDALGEVLERAWAELVRRATPGIEYPHLTGHPYASSKKALLCLIESPSDPPPTGHQLQDRVC